MTGPDRTRFGSTQVFHSVHDIPAAFGPSVAVIGNFDGVHRGHRQILDTVVAEARNRNALSIAITFDPHPEQFLRPGLAAQLLTPMPERLRLLAQTGVNAILVLRFDESLACLSAREFVTSILVDTLGVCSIHEGANFRFGHRAECGVVELTQFGEEFGFAVTVHVALETHGMTISSTAVRQLVTSGDLKRARWMLGHTFAVRSTPARGRGIGGRLLVPTINLAPYAGILPAFGVYATRLTVLGTDRTDTEQSTSRRCFEAVTNAGNRPTFGEPSFAVESYILNFEPVELTEETPLELEFLLRLRPEIQWPSPEALKAQIMKDVARAKRYFRLTHALLR